MPMLLVPHKQDMDSDATKKQKKKRRRMMMMMMVVEVRHRCRDEGGATRGEVHHHTTGTHSHEQW
jgi:hypothetical protein